MSQPLTEAGGSFGRVSLMDIDRPVAVHAHPQCHALFKLEGADGEFEVDGQRVPLAQGCAVLVNAWQAHGYPFRGPGPSRVLALYIEPAWLARFQSSFSAAARRDFFRRPCVALPASMLVLVHGLAEELCGAHAAPRRAAALLQALMSELASRYSRHGEFPLWARGAEATVADHRVRKAMRLIAERTSGAFDAEQLAREVALSRPHFFELFRRGLGVTPNVYRNVVRMERAYKALLGSAAQIGDIASALGFPAHPHFTRFFRDNHGVSPAAYRLAAWQVDG